MVNYWEKRNRWDEAAQYCENLLAVDECREDIYRKLMFLHKNMENKSEALLVYKRCRKSLSSVLGIEPSLETQALYKALQSDKS